MAEFALANLVGQIGYFKGPLLKNKYSFSGQRLITEDTEHKEMLSVVPSRAGFTRPFLFDDSLHLLVLCGKKEH
jgi:hypothetical protein